MKQERIDPYEDGVNRYALDHLARYFWCRTLASGKRVLDIACGTGFGSGILAAAGAKEVVGVDRDVESIKTARGRNLHLENVRFIAGDLYEMTSIGEEPFDCIVCFETLEHVPEPEKALQIFRKLLKPDGILVISVPGEDDILEDNPFHLQHFTRDRLEEMGRQNFSNVALWRQDFLACSQLRHVSGGADDESAVDDTVIRIKDGGARAALIPVKPVAPSTWILIGSQQPVDWEPAFTAMESVAVWQSMAAELREQYALCEDFAARYKDVFTELGTLKQRFTAALGWGKYHYAVVHNQEAPEEPEKRLVELAFGRENALRKEIAVLEKKVQELETELDRCRNAAEELAVLKARLFTGKMH